MFRVVNVLSAAEIAECKRIAAAAPFVDGRITNPHNKSKVNEQLHDADAYQKSSQLLLGALGRSQEFMEFAFPVNIAPPLITRYHPGMRYGAHADAAFIGLRPARCEATLAAPSSSTTPRTMTAGSFTSGSATRTSCSSSSPATRSSIRRTRCTR
jgi:PKHD-type hydroxylase